MRIIFYIIICLALVGNPLLIQAKEDKPKDKKEDKKGGDKHSKDKDKKEAEEVKKDDKNNEFSCDNIDSEVLKYTESEIIVLKRLNDRKKRLLEWENEVMEKENMLQILEDRIDRKIDEMKGLKAELQETLKTYQQKDKEKMLALVKIYETMKPTESAKIFEGMDIDTIMEILPLMKEAKVATILEKMDKKKAEKISVEYTNKGRLKSDKVK
ncbi:MAG: MotE family protein [Alphaproteobacteria bacterium]|jgi:flagellar motility protein MotE (MotC chaperone)